MADVHTAGAHFKLTTTFFNVLLGVALCAWSTPKIWWPITLAAAAAAAYGEKRCAFSISPLCHPLCNR